MHRPTKVYDPIDANKTVLFVTVVYMHGNKCTWMRRTNQLNVLSKKIAQFKISGSSRLESITKPLIYLKYSAKSSLKLG